MNSNRLIFLLASGLLLFGSALAQKSSTSQAGAPSSRQGASADTVLRRPSAWRITTPLGFHEAADMDTLQYNYQRQTIPSMVSDAYASTSNMGGEGINLLYFQRPRRSDFIFDDAMRPWIPSVESQKFYNVYVPMTLADYNWGGNRDTHQDRLRGTFAGNVNRNIGVGAFVDYIHSKGCYANLAVKNFSFGFSGYYTGPRYEMQAMYQQFNSLNRENGGITDPLYITDPAELQGGVSKIEPQSIPTRLKDAFNRITGARFFTTQAYKLGYWVDPEEGDTVSKSQFVAHTKLIYSLEYRHDRHAFRDFTPSEFTDFWANTYLNGDMTSDVTTQNTLTNTVGISMIEGFRSWAKFAIGAYASLTHRSTVLPTGHGDGYVQQSEDLTPLPAGCVFSPRKDENILWVGGRIEKTKGAILRYSADARFGLTDDYAGDLDINGSLTTSIPLRGDTLRVSAEGFFRNTTAPWLMKRYVSNHFAWNNDFSRTRSFRAGGTVAYPRSGTRLSAGIENVSGLLYFDSSSLPAQCSSPVSIFSASLEQKLNLGILHWDNSITYQTSSRADVLPLPKLTVYSNLYLQFTAFRVLHLQIGADCDYYTEYCGLNYQPALMAFYIDRSTNLGNFPFCNAYLNAKLYKTRFYVMLSHFNQGWFGKNYFALPGYPVNPRRLMIGLSVDFAN